MDFSHAPSVPVELLELKSHNYTEIPLGIRAAKTFIRGDWSLTPSADATFISSIGPIQDAAYNQHYGYAARTGSEWKVYGVAADHWGGRIKAGMDAKFRDRFNAGVHYTFEGRSHYKDHRIEASLGLAFLTTIYWTTRSSHFSIFSSLLDVFSLSRNDFSMATTF